MPISSPHLRDEIKELEKTKDMLPDKYQKAMLKAQTLVLKLLKDIRKNQVLDLEGKGIEVRTRDRNREENK